MRTERRTSGSARRQAKPMIERSNWRACLTLPYMPLKGGKWAYLCVWIDLFSRQVVGWQLGDNMQDSPVRGPLDRALLSLLNLWRTLVCRSDIFSESKLRPYSSRTNFVRVDSGR